MQAHDRDPSVHPQTPAPVSSGMFQAARPGSSLHSFVTVLLASLVFTIAFFHYRSEVDTTGFHPDESRWINRAHYLGDMLDPFGPTWNDQYLTRGQPPVGSYAMGVGLLLQGHDLDTNRAWDFRRSRDWNIDNGMYPTQEHLRAGRMTNVTLGAVAVVLTFLAVRLLSNASGGLVAAGMLTFHPLQSWHNRLALADTMLSVTLAAMILALILLLRRPTWFRAVTVGMLIGIGGANKLTPMALALVLAGAGAVVVVRTLLQNRRDRLDGDPWHTDIPCARNVGWMLLTAPLVAGATFVAVYPYLWKQPIERTLALLDFRRNEMQAQARLFPQFAVETSTEAIRRTWLSLADRWSATEWLLNRAGLAELGSALGPLDLILAILGVTMLTMVSMRQPFRSGHLLVLLVLLVQVTTIILAMRTDFERYYLPIVLSTSILAGVGFGIIGGMVWQLFERGEPARVRAPVTSSTTREGSRP
jgi:hypothetical protein